MLRGIDPEIWGPSGWKMLHGISFMKNKKPTKAWFLNLRYVIPCCTCQENFKMHTEALGDMHADIRKWVYKLHTRVNKMKSKENLLFSDLVTFWKNRKLTWTDITPFIEAMIDAHPGKNHVNSDKYWLFWEGLMYFMDEDIHKVGLKKEMTVSRGETRKWWKKYISKID